MKNLTGTTSQVSYATDLISAMNARVERMTAKGRTERVENQINFLAALQDGDSASNVIDICNNFDFFVHGVTNYSVTWSECIEKGRTI